MEPCDMPQSHLRDEQFSDLLLGTNPPSVRAHLKVCPQCSQEAAKVSGAIISFQLHSLLWAEQRAASRPLQENVRRPALAWLHRQQAWTAAALAIVLGAGTLISLRVHYGWQVQHPVAKAEPATVVSPTAIKADNELLTAIDGELRADDSTIVRLYGLAAASQGGRAKSSKRISN